MRKVFFCLMAMMGLMTVSAQQKVESDAHPDRYPTMRNFMPRYIETINVYEK